jgi:hypothetical protein
MPCRDVDAAEDALGHHGLLEGCLGGLQDEVSDAGSACTAQPNRETPRKRRMSCLVSADSAQSADHFHVLSDFELLARHDCAERFPDAALLGDEARELFEMRIFERLIERERARPERLAAVTAGEPEANLGMRDFVE